MLSHWEQADVCICLLPIIQRSDHRHEYFTLEVMALIRGGESTKKNQLLVIIHDQFLVLHEEITHPLLFPHSQWPFAPSYVKIRE